MKTIDLNCDLGEDVSPEGLRRDAALMAFVTSVNIACGGHAGNVDTMRHAVRAALLAGVAIGAHPGIDDREGGGRSDVVVTPEEAYRLIVEQVAALRAITHECGAELSHVKPHGTLYNRAARDANLADAVAKAVADVDGRLRLFGLAGSELLLAATRHGLRGVAEGFVDRAYQADGSLMPRTEPGAILNSPALVVAQGVGLAERGAVSTLDGVVLSLNPETLCLHGDTPDALRMAESVRDALFAAGIELRAIT